MDKNDKAKLTMELLFHDDTEAVNDIIEEALVKIEALNPKRKIIADVLFRHLQIYMTPDADDNNSLGWYNQLCLYRDNIQGEINLFERFASELHELSKAQRELLEYADEDLMQ